MQQLCQQSLLLLCLPIFNSTNFSTLVMVVSSDHSHLPQKSAVHLPPDKGVQEQHHLEHHEKQDRVKRSQEQGVRHETGCRRPSTTDKAGAAMASVSASMVCVAHGRQAEPA